MEALNPKTTWTPSTFLFDASSDDCILSNDRMSFFNWKGYNFNSAFAAIVWAKAKFSFNEQKAKEALSNQTKESLRRINKEVVPPNLDNWINALPKTLNSILLARFSQDKPAKDFLLSIGDRSIGCYTNSAKPDMFWSSGLTHESDMALLMNSPQWPGQNIFGASLKKVQTHLLEKPNQVFDGIKKSA